jgi:hypothetical protein
MRFVCFLCFYLAAFSITAQTRHVLKGFIRDSASSETLVNASITLVEQNKGTLTNNYGFYSISLQAGNHTLLVSSLGYTPKLVMVDIGGDKDLDIQLNSVQYTQQEVVVKARKSTANTRSTQMGKFEIDIQTVKALPAIFGETDILKTLQLLPGIRNAGEGNAGFYVRGGGPDQNLILLDEAVVYNTGHLFGFFSVFNSDAIKNLSLYKGGMPAQYGGRLSSVIDITMKEGNMKKMEGSAGIGLIASRFALEGPIVKEKSSFILSARRTYVDALVKPFIPKSSNFYGSGYYFFDVNAKANFKISNKDRIYISGYFGRDDFEFVNDRRSFSTEIPWGNSTATLRWNHVFNKKVFSNLSLVYNDYNFDFKGKQDNFVFNLSSGINDLTAKYDVDIFASARHRLKAGVQYTYHTFLPNLASGTQDSIIFAPASASRKFANEAGVYVQDDWDISRTLKFSTGMRASLFQQVGPYNNFVTDDDGNKIDSTVYAAGSPVKTYTGLEPRLALRISIDNNSSVKVSAVRNLQFIHLVSNAGTTLPTDIWVPSTLKVQPQNGWLYAAGYFRNFNNNMFETSIELYYKSMNNQIEYEQGYTPSLQDPELSFVFGKGWSYGAELFVNKQKGRWTGWLGYTLSWTWRRFDALNSGKKYPGRYDRRHDLSLVNQYTVDNKWKLSTVFVFGTGNAISLPERFYFINGILTQEYSSINEYRMKPYHRLDVSATYTPVPKKKRWLKGYWVFSFYNIYSRMNPYFYYYDQEGNAAEGTLKVSARQVSLFPIIPSVTWNVNF